MTTHDKTVKDALSRFVAVVIGAALLALLLGTQASVVRATGTVSVKSVTYVFDGKNLTSTVSLVDGAGMPVPNANVSAALYLLKSPYNPRWYWSGTTGADGTVTFVLTNARKGTYYTIVQNVVANGLVWDTITPANKFVVQ